ncbi:MAG: YdcF family protein, partial [Pseudoclavibacter sp.]
GESYEVLCLRPDPYTTQGEARDLANLSLQREWVSAIVITMTPHISRANHYIARCNQGLALHFVESERPIEWWRWIRQYAYETGAWAKAMTIWEC